MCLKLSRTLKKKVFLSSLPDQSVQRSCSIENDIKEGDGRTAFEGASEETEMWSSSPRVRVARDNERARARKAAQSMVAMTKSLNKFLAAIYMISFVPGEVMRAWCGSEPEMKETFGAGFVD